MRRTLKLAGQGFSLIELLVVLAIVGILASLAYPAYSKHIHRGRRTDAVQALSQIQLSQEHYRSNHPVYSGSLTDLGVVSLASSGGHYRIALGSDTTATGYSASATATGVQTADTGCRVMTISVVRGSAIMTPPDCWIR